MTDEFAQAKDLFDRNKRVFLVMGVWPLQPTHVTFFTWMIYVFSHVATVCADFYYVFGNAEMMIVNVSEMSLKIMIVAKMMVLKFSSRLKKLLERIIDDVGADHWGNSEEQEVYLTYNRIASSFFRIWFTTGLSASIIYHIKPLEFRLKSMLGNESMPFVLPYRTHLFFDVNDSSTFWLVWILQSPMICIHMFHSVTIAFLCSLVLHVCGKMAVLTFRIKNLDFDSRGDLVSFRMIFCDIVTRHREILQLSKDIERVFHVLLLEELLISTVIVGLTSYIVILTVDAEDKGVFIACLVYALAMLWLLYGYCVAGEYLLTERIMRNSIPTQSTNLYNAFYDCPWYDSSDSFKKQMIICMINAKKPLCLTGGGFYIFSLANYTGILKTTASYVSMLRKIA